MNCSIGIISLILGGMVFSACAADTTEPVNELNEGSDAYASAPAPMWLQLVRQGSARYLRGVNGVNLKCADGTTSYQCAAGAVDLSRLGVAAANRAEVQRLFDAEMLIIYGKPVVDRQNRVITVQPTRAFENISGWFDNGQRPNIYEVKKLAVPKPCEVQRSTTTWPPAGVFGPSTTTRAPVTKSCLYGAVELNTGKTYVLDDIAYEEDDDLPPGALTDIADRLRRKSPVAFDSPGVSNYSMPWERSGTIHTWLDVKKTYGR